MLTSLQLKMQKNRSFLHTNILHTLQTVKPFEIIIWVKKKRKEKKTVTFLGVNLNH